MKITYQPSDVIKYEFNTKDSKGNKVMDKLSHEETMALMNDISKQHGSGVIVQFSGDALAILKEGKLEAKSGQQKLQANEKYIKNLQEKSALLQSYLKPVKRNHLIIPNIRTNTMLKNSLQGADEKVTEAAYSIIQENLLPHNVGDMSEDERKELIYVGLEKAKYLAQNMEKTRADSFMEAMNTIAKYGLNGEKDSDGKVTYDIRWGAMNGAPDNYLSSGELMKRIDPEKYKEHIAMEAEAFKNNDVQLKMEVTKDAMAWARNNQQNIAQILEEESRQQNKWQQKIDNTVLESPYKNIDITDLHMFVNGIMEQSDVLQKDYLAENLKSFSQMLQ